MEMVFNNYDAVILSSQLNCFVFFRKKACKITKTLQMAYKITTLS